MKKETSAEFQSLLPFTSDMLVQLKHEGFKFVQIRGYSVDRHLDYMGPHYFILTPVKGPSTNDKDLEIYEPINSEILISWASESTGVKVLVSYK